MSALSNREYKVIAVESAESYEVELTFNDILNLDDPDDTLELIYAIQEVGDKVLDLKVNESMYFQPYRDMKESKGIIIRIK